MIVWSIKLFEYISDNKGINTESSYMYEAVDVGATGTGYADIQSKSESALQQAVTDPISVAFDACINLIDLVYNEASWVKLLWSRFRPGKRTYQIAYQIFKITNVLK